jgi:uncharacterized membrane protein YfcA
MRIAWPELIVLIFLATILVVLGNFVALYLASHYFQSQSAIVAVFFVLMLFDLWGIVRLIDWAFAGPSRRKGLRIL